MRRNLFITEKGYIGLSSQHVVAGDQVVIFQDASVLFVIRPCEDDQFELVGESYVNGIMDVVW